jgi:hypothetical protein
MVNYVFIEYELDLDLLGLGFPYDFEKNLTKINKYTDP